MELVLALAIVVVIAAILVVSAPAWKWHSAQWFSEGQEPGGMLVKAIGILPRKDPEPNGNHTAWLRVEVRAPRLGGPDSLVTLESLSLFGSPGTQLERCERTALDLSGLPSSDVSGGSLGWLQVPWNQQARNYTLLVEGDFLGWRSGKVTAIEGSTVTLRFRADLATDWVQGVLVPVQVILSGVSAFVQSPNVTVSGAFYGQSHVALYDVSVDTFPQAVARIEVSAGKSTPFTYLGGVDNPTAPYSGIYTGFYDNTTSTYYCRVVTEYKDGTSASILFSFAAVSNQNLLPGPV